MASRPHTQKLILEPVSVSEHEVTVGPLCTSMTASYIAKDVSPVELRGSKNRM